MFVYFHRWKEFHSKIFSFSRIVALKFLNIFDIVWVELQHITDNFVYRSPWYVHSTCNSTYRSHNVFASHCCFLPLQMQQPPRFPKKHVSFSSQVKQIKARSYKLFHHFPQILVCHWPSALNAFLFTERYLQSTMLFAIAFLITFNEKSAVWHI